MQKIRGHTKLPVQYDFNWIKKLPRGKLEEYILKHGNNFKLQNNTYSKAIFLIMRIKVKRKKRLWVFYIREIWDILTFNCWGKFHEEEPVFLHLNSMRIFNVKFHSKEINILCLLMPCTDLYFCQKQSNSHYQNNYNQNNLCYCFLYWSSVKTKGIILIVKSVKVNSGRNHSVIIGRL